MIDYSPLGPGTEKACFRSSSTPGLGSGSQESMGTERADVCQCGSCLGPSASLILRTLEHYLEIQGKQNVCALRGILARLQLDWFEPAFFQSPISTLSLPKALPKLPPHRSSPVHVRVGLSRLIKKMSHLIEMETFLWLTVWPVLEKNMASLKLHPEVSLPCCEGQLNGWRSQCGWIPSGKGQVFLCDP